MSKFEDIFESIVKESMGDMPLLDECKIINGSCIVKLSPMFADKILEGFTYNDIKAGSSQDDIDASKDVVLRSKPTVELMRSYGLRLMYTAEGKKDVEKVGDEPKKNRPDRKGHEKPYHQYVELLDWGRYISKVPKSERSDYDTKEQAIRSAMKGSLKLHCSCPAFRWQGYAYMMKEVDALSDKGEKEYEAFRGDYTPGKTPEQIEPTRNNPGLEGLVCKHLLKVLSVFSTGGWSQLNSLTRNTPEIYMDILEEEEFIDGKKTGTVPLDDVDLYIQEENKESKEKEKEYENVPDAEEIDTQALKDDEEVLEDEPPVSEIGIEIDGDTNVTVTPEEGSEVTEIGVEQDEDGDVTIDVEVDEISDENSESETNDDTEEVIEEIPEEDEDETIVDSLMSTLMGKILKENGNGWYDKDRAEAFAKIARKMGSKCKVVKSKQKGYDYWHVEFE
jgi:hypothetical protein